MTESTPDAGMLERSPAGRIGRSLHDAALCLVLAVLVCRCFLGEMPWRESLMSVPRVVATLSGGTSAADNAQVLRLTVGRGELSRTIFAMALFSAAWLWMLGGAISGRWTLRHAPLGLLTLGFIAWALACSLRASDRRAAMDGFLDQASMTAAAFVMAQLCADRRRFALTAVVLAGLGGTMAVKGLYQSFVEAPERVRMFEQNPVGDLLAAGIAPGTPQARLFEARLRDLAPFGYLNLANLFASMMIVLAAATAGLAWDKLAKMFTLPKPLQTPAKGEISLPKLAGGVSAVVALSAVAVLAIAQSVGASVAGIGAIFAAAVLAGLLKLREALARRWRSAVIVATVLLAIGAGAVITYGLRTGGLPGKTLTFRWQYWTTTAQIVRDNPLYGVAPGNFSAAYLRYRPAAAEESVKDPHNFVLNALVQYGLPGALAYLGTLGYLVVGAFRPSRTDARESESAGATVAHPVLAIVFLVAAMLVARTLLANLATDAALWVLEGWAPAVVLAAMLLAALWSGGKLFDGLLVPGRNTRIFLAAGAAGFLVHNLVEGSLFVPAAATAFFIAAGACLGQGGAGKIHDAGKYCWFAVACGLAAIVLAAAVCVPAWRKATLVDDAVEQFSRGRADAGMEYFRRAVDADAWDSLVAADAAEIAEALSIRDGESGGEFLAQANQLSREALRRDPASPEYWRQSARILLRMAGRTASPAVTDEILLRMGMAVGLDPQNLRWRVEYAGMLLAANHPIQALHQAELARKINAQLNPESVQRLTPPELSGLEQLEIRAKQTPASSRPSGK
jgi:O-antigen ligase